MTVWDYIVVGLALLFSFILQYSVLPMLGVLNIAPNILMGTIVTIGLLFGPFPALIGGIIFGFFSDALFGITIGIVMLQLSISGFSAGMLRGMLRGDNIGLVAIFTLIGCLVCAVLEFIIMYLMRIPPSLNGMLLLRTVLSAGLSALASLPIYFILYSYSNSEKRLRRVSGNIF